MVMVVLIVKKKFFSSLDGCVADDIQIHPTPKQPDNDREHITKEHANKPFRDILRSFRNPQCPENRSHDDQNRIYDIAHKGCQNQRKKHFDVI